MTIWDQSAIAANVESFAVAGEPITYTPAQGQGTPIVTTCLLRQRISGSASPGFFADIEVDPLVISTPLRGDQVTWKDGVVYTVAQVINDPYGLVTVALHRLIDPDFIPTP